MASFAFARYSLSGYVLMSVWRFSRPTSCRPFLMSTIARSYRILSGAAELSSAAAAAFFLDLECLDWASVATLENNTAIPSMASRVRRNRHPSGKFGLQGVHLRALG